MDVVPDRDPESPGLSREAVVEAALGIVDAGGVDGLSMRALGDSLGVKAASLYWHFKDKEQLLDAVVGAVLDRVHVPASRAPWRDRARAACDRLTRELQRHPAMAALMLGRLPEVRQSRLAAELAGVLAAEGLPDAESAAASLLVQTAASASLASAPRMRPRADQQMRLEVDAGSWRVNVRAGSAESMDVASAVGSGRGGPFVEARPDGTVIVRNWRGGNRGSVQLNPAYTWFVKVHSGAWNVALDLAGLRVNGLDFDSGTGNITCTLPAPSGVVPVRVNSGIINVTLHRPRNTAARAIVHSGCFRVRFDDQTLRATSADVRWQSAAAAAAADCYDVTVHSGCIKVAMDASATAKPAPPAAVELSDGVVTDSVSTLDLLLDGIAHRLRA